MITETPTIRGNTGAGVNSCRYASEVRNKQGVKTQKKKMVDR